MKPRRYLVTALVFFVFALIALVSLVYADSGTPGTGTYYATTSGVKWPQQQTHPVKWIIWTNITSDSDDLVVQEYDPDTNAWKNLFSVKGKTGWDMKIDVDADIRGCNISTLDSGTVQIRFGE